MLAMEKFEQRETFNRIRAACYSLFHFKQNQ